jgi:hypothetical protein
MSLIVIGLMVGAFLFVGYKYFTEKDDCYKCTGNCEQGRKECDCE